MVEALAHKNDFRPLRLQHLQASHAIRLQVRLEFVLEVFVAEKVEPIATDSAQNTVDHPRRKNAMCGVQKRTERRHQEDQAAASHTRRKGLGVPGKEGYRLYRGEIEKTALDPPVDRSGRTGLSGMWS